MSETCPEKVHRGGHNGWGGRYEPCGKAIKRDGLCGTHANAKDRDAERKAAYDKLMVEARAGRELAQQYIALGYTAWGDSHGVHLDLAAATRLHAKLAGGAS